jgi:hypothetical protein
MVFKLEELMKTKSSRIVLLAFIVVALVLVGVLVIPKPKPALAVNTTFGVNVWFLNDDIDPDNITFAVCNYSDQGRLLLIEEVAMDYMGHDQEGFDKWRAHFEPDPDGVYWSAKATFEAAYKFENVSNPYPIGIVIFQGVNINNDIQINIIEP